MRSKQCRTVLRCDNYFIREMICLRQKREGLNGDCIAAIIQHEYLSENCEICIIEAIDEWNFKIVEQSILSASEDHMWTGQLVEMKDQFAVLDSVTSTLFVWKRGELGAKSIKIPDGGYEPKGMCVLQNVLGREELLAFHFHYSSLIGMFAIESTSLVNMRNVQLECIPGGLLWLPNKRTLVVSNHAWDMRYLCALRMTERDLTSYMMELDQKHLITVLGWFVLHDQSGNEKAIAIFDQHSSSVMFFQMA